MNEQRVHRPLGPGKVVWVSVLLLALLVVAGVVSLGVGTAQVTVGQLWDVITGTAGEQSTPGLIVLKIRLPRMLLAGLVGLALSVGGLVFQALLRNPLADPFILGVSSGGACGAVLGIVFGLGFSVGIPLSAFAGALVTVFLVLAIGRRRMGMESSTILLAGVIINAFFTAVIMSIVATAVDDRLHAMLFWLYGDLSQSRMSQSVVVAPVALAGTTLIYAFARHLNLITAGEDAALQLGVDVEWVKRICFLVVSLMIGLVVAFSGLIGFVGLIVPHLGRMALGSDHRLLIPVSALGGAIFLIIADALARTVISPSELPVGVVTAFIGAPFFIYLLKKRGSGWSRS